VTIHLDTSVLIDVATKARSLLPTLRLAVSKGHRIGTCAPVMYEWLRGPRIALDLENQRELCPGDRVVTFGAAEAALAADLYRRLRDARGREMDIAIAACAIEHGAALWTVNARDFRDIPGLQLYEGK
jgi:predicted nucleic acid-binding protein